MKSTIRLLLTLLITIGVASTSAFAQKPSSMSAVNGAITPQLPFGRFELFVGVSGDQGGVYHTWKLADGSGWQPSWQVYSPAPDDNPHGLVAGRDGSGRIIVAWISKGNINIAEAIHADASLLTARFWPRLPVSG